MARCQQCLDRVFRRGPVDPPVSDRPFLMMGNREALSVTQRPSSSATAAVAAVENGEESYSIRVDGFEMRRTIGQGRRSRHVVYTLTVGRGDARWPIRRRFRQVAALHNQLLQSLGRSAMRNGLPALPPRASPRSVWYGQHDDRFLAARVVRLQHYFEDLLRFIPYVDQCEALHEFLCSVDVSNMSYEALLGLGEAIGRVNNSPAVDPAAIDALPRRQEIQAWKGRGEGAVSSSGCCVICQDAMGPDDEDIRILPCGHEYHYKCIAQWIPHSNTCCVCNAMAILPTPPADAESVAEEK